MQTLQSVKTAFQIFEMVAAGQPIGLSELARRSGVNKTTVQRCLVTLQELGWLRCDAVSAKWLITGRSLSLSSQARHGASITQIALPVMMRLRDDAGENVHLAVPEDNDAVLLERLESPHPIRIYYAIGSRAPLNAAAAGKAILASLKPDAMEVFLKTGLRSVTKATITGVEQLTQELAEIRRRGWASTTNELNDGASAVAAAIIDSDRNPIAAISVSAPTGRMTSDKRKLYAQRVVEAAREISAAVGATLDGD